MKKVSDRNYTDPARSNVGAAAERVGDLTGESPSNEAVDRNKASKMANLLEGLKFPATKEQIRKYVNQKSPGMGNRMCTINDKACRIIFRQSIWQCRQDF